MPCRTRRRTTGMARATGRQGRGGTVLPRRPEARRTGALAHRVRLDIGLGLGRRRCRCSGRVDRDLRRRAELVVPVEAHDGTRAVGERGDVARAVAEPLVGEVRDRSGRVALATPERDPVEHVVEPVDVAPLVGDEVVDEAGACAPKPVALHLQGAVVERDERGGDVPHQDAARARNRVEHRVLSVYVEHNGLRDETRRPAESACCRYARGSS